MSDYIPGSDADFSAWADNFIAYANDNLGALGLTAADLAPLQAAHAAFKAAVAANIAAQAQAQGTRQTKDDRRATDEGAFRPLVGRLQASPAVTDPQRQALSITVASGTRTAAPTPTSRPVASLDTSQRLQHTISFVDELMPTSRAKPAGVSGCEIWMKIGSAPVDPSELTYLATDTRTPYAANFNGEDAGKTAYYMLRWVNTRGERGPWSHTVSGTITN
jgi:hypothetical protein